MSTIASPSATAVAINELESLAKKFRDARSLLSERITALEEDTRAIYKRRLPGIKQAVETAKDAKAALSAAVEANPAMFVKPRTMTLHGVTFGFKKGAGKITWECEDDVLVHRIEKQFADDKAALDLLIIETRSPSKDALKQLDAKVLAKLGVEIEGTGDVVVVRASDSEVDKLVKRILEEGAASETIETNA